MGKKTVVLTETQLKKVINRIINEQTAPPTNTQQQNTNSPQQILGGQIINAVKSGQRYITSPLFPKKILANLNLDPGDGRNGFLTFQVYALTDPSKLTRGYSHSLRIYANRPEGTSVYDPNAGNVMKDDNSIIDLFTKGTLTISDELKMSTDDMAHTIPVDIADVMFVCGGEKNPKLFLDFMKQLEPNAPTWLQQALVRKANGQLNQVVDKQDAQNMLRTLFPQQQAQPQQAQPTK